MKIIRRYTAFTLEMWNDYLVYAQMDLKRLGSLILHMLVGTSGGIKLPSRNSIKQLFIILISIILGLESPKL